MSCSVGSMFPGLGHLLLLRLNPISLLALGQSLSVLTAKIFIDFDELYLADVAGALFNTALICGTMLPLSIYCGKILLQTAPEHLLPLLDKSLREVSALDGVLELKGEHFWTIAFGSYAGSVHVRVRREADEQVSPLALRTHFHTNLHLLVCSACFTALRGHCTRPAFVNQKINCENLIRQSL
ncbi:Zinc transporter 6 [Geodia barretti]|uniref:Zinc transporter 6 n=1 Tax=Geodia barretti TaxID=519541 RepID=A0AA35WU98_GEOBA|nr:Zinc transporter 6 [Geodia barretti]